MENQILKVGDVKITNARKVKNGKVELTFQENIQLVENISALSLLNQDDEAFRRKNTYAWVNTSVASAAKFFNLDEEMVKKLESLQYHESVELDIINPTHQDKVFRIRIIESITPDEYQEQDIEKHAKKRGKDGSFIYHKGNHIFRRQEVVVLDKEEEPLHILLKADQNIPLEKDQVEQTQEYEAKL